MMIQRMICERMKYQRRRMTRLGCVLLMLAGCGGEPDPARSEPVRTDFTVDTSRMSKPVREVIETALAGVRAEPESPDAWLRVGQSLQVHDRFDDAHVAYTKALALDADHPRANYLRALIDERRGDFETAIDGFRRTERVSRARGGVGYAPAQRRIGTSLVALGRLDEAEEVLSALVQEFGQYEDGRLAYADLLVRTGRAAEAVEQLALVDEAAPGDRRVAEKLARAHHLLGNAERANQLTALARTLRETVPLRDRLMAEVTALGRSLTRRFEAVDAAYRAGQLEPALAGVEALLADHPDERQVRVIEGKILAGLGRHADALEAFRALLIDEPDNEVRLLAGRSAVEVSEPELALGWAHEALAEEESSAARALLGRALLQLGRHAEADAQYRALLDQHGTLPVNDWMMWGLVGFGLSQPAAAVERFRAALALVPDFPAAHFQIGVGLEALGEPREALAAFETAQRLDPALPTAPRIQSLRAVLGQ